MAVSITFPAAVGPVGPGYLMAFNISAGPIPNDDYIECVLYDTAAATVMSAMTVITNGLLNVSGLMGVRDPAHTSTGGLGFQSTLHVGGAVTVQVIQRHANHTAVATFTQAGWNWSPVDGLGELHAFYGGAGSLADVLAAVRTVITKPGQ